MLQGRTDHELEILRAQRLTLLEGFAHSIAAVYNSAGKSCEEFINPRTVYESMTGNAPEAEEIVVEEDPGGSLSEAWHARKAKEEAERALNGVA